jgi:hypothetical protein
MAVRRYLPLSQLHAQYDYYRQFELQFAGILYYARQSDVEVVSVDRLLFHFAKTPFVDRVIGEHMHVLPLAKVSNCPYCPWVFLPDQQDMLFDLDGQSDGIDDVAADDEDEAWMDVDG